MTKTDMSAEPEKRPTVYVIAGPNGAGKTTFGMRYLPLVAGCTNFINADLIAQGLSPLDAQAAEIEAGRVFLRRIDEQIGRGVDFAFETTLSGRAYVRLFARARAAGYRIVIFYLWIPSAAFSAQRVASRVAGGGHDIPQDVIARRYLKGLANFFELYAPLADRAVVVDNSTEISHPVAEFDRMGSCVLDAERFGLIQTQLRGRSDEKDNQTE